MRLLVAVATTIVLSACGDAAPTPTPTRTPLPEPPTPSPTATAVPTPTPTARVVAQRPCPNAQEKQYLNRLRESMELIQEGNTGMIDLMESSSPPWTAEEIMFGAFHLFAMQEGAGQILELSSPSPRFNSVVSLGRQAARNTITVTDDSATALDSLRVPDFETATRSMKRASESQVRLNRALEAVCRR